MAEYKYLLYCFLLWFAFGFQHSFLAQRMVKEKIRQVTGGTFVDYVYQLVYFISQCIIFSIFWHLITTLPKGQVFFVLTNEWKLVCIILKVVGSYILLASVIAVDVNYFIGTKQFFIFMRSLLLGSKKPKAQSLEADHLSTNWIFIFCRHPMYVGILVMYLTHTHVITSLFFANLFCLISYIYIGIHFEEKQLVRKFGKAYISYCETTPKLNFVRGVFMWLNR